MYFMCKQKSEKPHRMLPIEVLAIKMDGKNSMKKNSFNTAIKVQYD